jgi:hypothetical protein
MVSATMRFVRPLSPFELPETLEAPLEFFTRMFRQFLSAPLANSLVVSYEMPRVPPDILWDRAIETWLRGPTDLDSTILGMPEELNALAQYSTTRHNS